MNWLSLAEIAALCDGRMIGPDVPVPGVSTDTRTLRPGELFVALQGPSFDGHEFVGAAAAVPAGAVMVSRQVDTILPQVLVQDTLQGLQGLARGWRRRLTATVVALTGSNGKTTVKEMTASILSRLGEVCATRGNLNNHIGVPLTLLSVRRHHRFAVVEMGANHPGEIQRLSAITQPDVALINNAAPAHLEGFGNLEGVARAKGEILDGLREGGTAVLNRDDRFFDTWRVRAAGRPCLSFGMAPGADVWGEAAPGGALRMETPLGRLEVQLPLTGRHNIMNALAAAAAAIACGAGARHIVEGLEAVRPMGGRQVERPGIGGAHVVDDTYNANPASLEAALEVLAARGGERWLVLGDMGELGPDAQSLHRKAGQSARRHGVQRLYALGELSAEAVAGFGTGARHFGDAASLLEALKGDLGPRVTVLVKGSRAMHLERIVDGLLDSPASSGRGGGHEHAA